jgi:hypothetical protein
MAILLRSKAVDDFVQCAVASAGDDELPSLDSGSLSHHGGIAWRSRFLKVSLNASERQNTAGFIEHAPAAFASVAGVRVVNQQSIAKA